MNDMKDSAGHTSARPRDKNGRFMKQSPRTVSTESMNGAPDGHRDRPGKTTDRLATAEVAEKTKQAAAPTPAPSPVPEGASADDIMDPHSLDASLAAHIAEHIAESPEGTSLLEPVLGGPLPVDRFADRELSWLAFNKRVLELAEDPRIPLLERVRFLAIFASNLDEFFMVRVAGLKRRIATGIAVTSASGLSPRQALSRISEEAHSLMERHARVFEDEVQPALAGEGITLVHWGELDTKEQERLHKFFRKQIFPVLTPLAVDPAHPFPYISGLSLNLAVVVANPASRASRCRRCCRASSPWTRRASRGAPAPRRPTRSAGRSRSCRSRRSSPSTSTTCSPGWRCGRTTRSASPATRTWTSRRTTPRTCSRPWRRSCSGAGSDRRCAWRSPRTSARASAT
jgi:polyphosphate kinase